MSKSSNRTETMSSDALARMVRVIVMHDGPVIAPTGKSNTVETCKRVMDTLSMNFSCFDRREAERLIIEEVMGA